MPWKEFDRQSYSEGLLKMERRKWTGWGPHVLKNNTTVNSLGVLLSSIDPGYQPTWNLKPKADNRLKKTKTIDKKERERKKEQEKASKQARKRRKKGRKEGKKERRRGGRKKSLSSLAKGPGKENDSKGLVGRLIPCGSSRPNPLTAAARSRNEFPTHPSPHSHRQQQTDLPIVVVTAKCRLANPSHAVPSHPQQQSTQSAHISGNRETQEPSSSTAPHQVNNRQAPPNSLVVPADSVSPAFHAVTEGNPEHLPSSA